MILYGIHGKARSGKDTLARLLNVIQPFQRMAFADPLKRAVAIAFNIPESVVFSDDKDQIIEPWGLSLRTILQQFGTESMRDVFGDDFWVNRWQAEFVQIRERENVAVTDVRFPNEAFRIRALGGTIIHLYRDGAGLAGAAAQHASERGLPIHTGDIIIENNGTIEDLQGQVEALLTGAIAQ